MLGTWSDVVAVRPVAVRSSWVANDGASDLIAGVRVAVGAEQPVLGGDIHREPVRGLLVAPQLLGASDGRTDFRTVDPVNEGQPFSIRASLPNRFVLSA
jgi:hypothetical protein